MSLPSFRRSRGDAAQSHTVEDAAAILAERKAHAEKAQADRDAKHAAYREALAAAGPELDTPEVERAGREWNRAIERFERAQEAVRVAENEHAAATVEAARRSANAQWGEIEKLFSARAKAAEKYVSLIPALVTARAEFLRAAQRAHDALPGAVKSAPGSDVYNPRVAAADAHAELQRLGLLPDPRRASMGIPRGQTLTESSAALCAMVKRTRNESERAA